MIQIIVIVSLGLSLLATIPPTDGSPALPEIWLVHASPMLRTLLTAAAVLAVVLLSAGVNMLAAGRLDRTGELNRSRYRRTMAGLLWLMLLTYAATLLVVGWHRVVLDALGLAGIPVLAELAAWAPFLLMLLGAWASAYPVDARARLLDMHRRLAAGLPTPPVEGGRAVWGFWQFLAFQVRFHLLLILLPLALLLGMRWGIEYGLAAVSDTLEAWGLTAWQFELLAGGLGLATVMAVFLVAPVVLAWVLRTAPLPDGPLRTKLERVLARAGVAVRRILLWRTHGMVSNAAVMGIWGRLRYVMLTDGLIETLGDEQIEGVFGHELGHVVHRHIVYYLLFVFAALLWSSVALAGLDALETSLWPSGGGDWLMAAGLAGGVLLFAAWAAVFCWISRRFEWQADLTGAQMISLSEMPNRHLLPGGADDDSNDPADRFKLDRPPAPAATELYASALFRIAQLNAIDPKQRSLRHGSIYKRTEHVRELSESGRFERFHFIIGLIKLAILTAIAAAAIILSLMPG